MEITKDMMQSALMVAAPCDCNAPIAYTCGYWTQDTPEGQIEQGVELFVISLQDLEVTSIFNNVPEGAERDDLNLICTKCGKSWAPFNPLF